MGGYIIFVGTLLCLTFSQSEGKVVQQSKENIIVLGNKRLEVADNVTLQRLGEKCTTQTNIWKCCIGIDIGKNITACVSIEYLEDEYGLELNVTVNDISIYSEKVSARNPPPICFNVPYLQEIAAICFRFHDLDTHDKTLTGCINIEGHLKRFRFFNVQLDCFAIPIFFSEQRKYAVNFMKNEIP